MNAIFSENVIAQLELLVRATSLPARTREHGRELLERLRAPVRVVVAGPARGGKSKLVELLSGGDPLGRAGGGAPGATGSVIDNLVVIEHGSGGGAHQPPIADSAPHIILWCTQGFAHDEAETWARVPDRLKDHAFLVLTKADELIRLGLLQERLDDLCDVVEAEFHSLLPIATTQALAARDGHRLVDPAAHARSGAKALFEALERMVSQGRRADMDAAALFLRRHGGLAIADLAPADLPPAAETAAGTAPAPAEAGPDGDAAVSERALRLFDEYGEDFPDEIDGTDPGELAALLSLCARTSDALNALVAEAPDVSRDLTEDMQEADETMILLALEKTEAAAADAVTLLLQLRRGFETRRAA